LRSDRTRRSPPVRGPATVAFVGESATRLAARAAAQDVAVILDVTPRVPHVFQSFAAVLEEGDLALDRVTEFLWARTGATAGH
jgi:epsilon-lactone hydrolase